MIITIEDARKEISALNDWNDAKLKRKLKAIEQAIRSYTNNNFQDRCLRRTADIIGSLFVCDSLTPFEVGDTVQISESALNNGLYVVTSADDAAFTVDEHVKEEADVLVTKVSYPSDVIDCAFNLLNWEVNNRDKVGIQSETLSRHSVTYFNMDGDNSIMGYPKSLFGCLKPYRKARC